MIVPLFGIQEYAEEKLCFFWTHQCDVCGYKTNTKVTLENHKRTNHTEGVRKARLWECSECGFKVVNQDQLRRHMQLNHVKGTLRCQFCPEDNKKLYNPQKLRYHINQQHKREGVFSTLASRLDG